MIWKRLALLTCLILLLSTWTPGVMAQEEPAETEEKKEGFWGNKFALFIEAFTGSADPDDFDASVNTSTRYRSFNALSFEGVKFARAGVGWTLPHDRGEFRLVFNGYKEDGYTFSAAGDSTDFLVVSILTPGDLNFETFLPWWQLQIIDGQLTAESTTPFWRNGFGFDLDGDGCFDSSEFRPSDDVNCDGLPSADEIQYGDTPDRTGSRSVTNDLQNRFQTVDLLYGRKFGGRRVGGRWSAGLRHYNYEGNIPVPAWLAVGLDGLGYTDGSFLAPLLLSQKTSGTGPTGSLSVVYRMFREKLELFAEGRIAFLLQTLETDSGSFNTIVQDTNAQITFTIPARLTNSLDKDVWNVGVEVGATFMIKGGLSIEVAYHTDAFHDSILLPKVMAIPENILQMGLETSAVYGTQDIRTDGYRAGLRFQF